LHYTDTAGASDLTTAWLWFADTVTGSAANSCLMYYNRFYNALYLLSDNASTWLPSVTVGSSGSASNAQCTINAATSTAIASGTDLALNLSVSFKPAFAGSKSVKMNAQGNSGQSGWLSMGTWQ